MPYPDDAPHLTDGRVTLRALHVDDALRVVEQCNDPESITWTTVPRPYGSAEALDWITRVAPEAWADGTDLVLAVEAEGRFAGSVALRPRGAGEGEIGFGLHPDARGRGVMRAALTLLLDWAFEEQGYAVVHWRANVGNWASRRVAWAVGFTFGPTIPRLLDHRGERVDGWTAWIGRDDPRRPVSPWHEVPVLEAGDLRLRPWTARDGDRLVETARDPVLRAFLPDSPLPTEAGAVEAYLTRVHLSVADGARLAWCVADAATDRALAGVALFDLEGPDGAGAAQVGFWSHPEGRGRGVVTRALERLAAYAFAPGPEGLGMRRLYLLTAASNTAARRVAERAGFEHVGTERLGAPVADGFDDNVVYDRLAPRG